jgi:hypothetical protein
MPDDKSILRWDKFVFYASLVALAALGFFSWYQKQIVIPEQKKIIESKAYQYTKELKKENDRLQSKIDSLEHMNNNEDK